MFSSNTAAFPDPPSEVENEQTPMLAVPTLATTKATALAAHRGKQHRNVRAWFGGVSVLAVMLVGTVWMQQSSMAPQKDKQTPVAAATRSQEDRGYKTVRMLTFEEYITKFDKTYATPAEAHRRQQIYEDNVKIIDQHNQDAQATFQLGINQFTDMYGDETPKGLNTGYKGFSKATHDFTTDVLLRGGSLDEDANFVTTSLLRSHNNLHRHLQTTASTVPNERDWRTGHTKHGAPLTTPVKDQGYVSYRNRMIVLRGETRRGQAGSSGNTSVISLVILHTSSFCFLLFPVIVDTNFSTHSPTPPSHCPMLCYHILSSFVVERVGRVGRLRP